MWDGSVKTKLNEINGLLVAPGFGDRGIEGKIMSSRHARENKIPFFGICLGLQCAIIDFARNACGLDDANSSEFSDCKHPVIDLMAGQKDVKEKGATMRLGSYACKLKVDTKAHRAYGQDEIQERHRHRFEVNNVYRKQLEESGLVISGENSKLNLVEMIEVEDHPWFVGVQFHPELKSRIVKAHPLFREFIAAAIDGKIKSDDKMKNEHSLIQE